MKSNCKTCAYSVFLLLLIVVVTSWPAQAQLDRGVWFWNSTTLPDMTTSPYGSSIVVGDAAKEDETIDFFTVHGVKRVFGSYQNRPLSEPSVIAAWNAKLHTAGISSQVLIDGVEVDDPADVSSILSKVTNRLINFNAGVAASGRFDALHLDLEPQGSPAWAGATAAGKRALLEDLYEAYVAIRAHLNLAGMHATPIYADIHYTWDKLPADGGSIGWADAADRTAWFTNIAFVLEGVSIMTFTKDNFVDLDEAVAYERYSALFGRARLAIQPKVGPGLLWSSILSCNAVIQDCESHYGPTGAIDLENYAYWRHAIETTQPHVDDPISAVLTGVSGPIKWGTVDAPVLEFDGLPGYLYVVRFGSDLQQINKEIARVKTKNNSDAVKLRVPIQANGVKGFWQVERIKDPEP